MEIGPFPPGKRGRTGRSSEGLSSRDHSVTLTKKGGAGKSGMEQNASVSRRKLCHGKSTYRVSSSLLHCSAISFACSITSSCKKKRGDFCRKPPRIQEESSVQLDTLAEWSPVTQADKNSPRPNRWVGCDSTEWTPPPSLTGAEHNPEGVWSDASSSQCGARTTGSFLALPFQTSKLR